MAKAGKKGQKGQELRITWVRNKGRYASGELCFLGKWQIGGYHWGSTGGVEERFVPTCRLPGIRPTLRARASEEEARAVVENAVAVWMEGTEGVPETE